MCFTMVLFSASDFLLFYRYSSTLALSLSISESFVLSCVSSISTLTLVVALSLARSLLVLVLAQSILRELSFLKTAPKVHPNSQNLSIGSGGNQLKLEALYAAFFMQKELTELSLDRLESIERQPSDRFLLNFLGFQSEKRVTFFAVFSEENINFQFIYQVLLAWPGSNDVEVYCIKQQVIHLSFFPYSRLLRLAVRQNNKANGDALLPCYNNKSIMLKLFTTFLLLSVAFSASIACTQYQPSKNGNASDCSITRVDAQTISWGARINFNVNFSWTSKSFSNVLADMGSPRLPISPKKSSCDTKAGSYTKGQSVIVNCTQSFDSIPVGYSNVISAFDGDDYTLGFSTKIPLSQPHLLQE